MVDSLFDTTNNLLEEKTLEKFCYELVNEENIGK